TASGHEVAGRHLPAASRPFRGSLATVGGRVDRAASESEPRALALRLRGLSGTSSLFGRRLSRHGATMPPVQRAREATTYAERSLCSPRERQAARTARRRPSSTAYGRPACCPLIRPKIRPGPRAR